MRHTFFIFVNLFIVALSIFEEQLGEYDWKKENFGFIQQSISHADNIYAVTSENALASINADSGEVQWRVVFPQLTTFEKLIIVQQSIVTLSSQVSFSNGTELFNKALVQSWSLSTGALLWDTSIAVDADQHFDILHDAAHNLLYVLGGNSIHFIRPSTSSTSKEIEFWTWSASTVSSTERFVVSSLIVPTEAPGDNHELLRVAAGCFVHAASDCGKCGRGAIVKLNIASKAVSVDTLGALTHVSPRQLRAVVGSHEKSPGRYAADDVIFGPASACGSDLVTGVELLSLVDGSSVTLRLPLSVGGASQAQSLVFAAASGEVQPGMQVCGDQGCVVVVAQQATGTGQWDLSVAAHCTASDAQVAVEPFLHYGGLASAAHCMSAAWDEGASRLRSVTISSSSAAQRGAAAVAVALDLAHPTSAQLRSGPAARAFHHVAVSRAQAGSVATHRILLVLHSGLTLMLEASGAAASVLWSRDEALTRLQQVALVDSESALHLGGGAETNAVPSFLERLSLQREELNAALAQVAGVDSWARGLQKLRNLALVRQVRQLVLRGDTQELGRAEPRDVAKLRLFGFGKLAVGLCYARDLDRQLAHPELAAGTPPVRFSAAGLKVVALDVLQSLEEADLLPQWTAYPVLSPAEGDPQVAYVRLLADGVAGARSSVARSVTLVVGTTAGRTLVWCLDAKTGHACDSRGPHDAALPPAMRQAQRRSAEEYSRQSGGKVSVVAEGAAVTAGLLRSVALKTDSAEPAAPHRAHMLIHSAGEPGSVAVALLVAPAVGAQEAAGAGFVHFVDRAAGRLSIYQLGDGKCADFAVRGALSTGYKCVPGSEVAAVLFPPASETIVGVAYRDSRDEVNSRAAILGDDSVLLKYLNPNLVLVAAVSPPEAAASEYFSPAGDLSAQNETAGPPCTLTLTLVDTVTGRVVKRVTHESAALPVHAVLVENAIVATYWNVRAKRTELSSTALFEGVIDKYGLGPLAARASSAQPAAYLAPQYSAYSAVAPMAVQRTYTLPRAVTALGVTLTASGVSNKNVLVALRGGQVYSVDMRLIHPRRPLGEPSPSEREEGLAKYSPFVGLGPLAALTYSTTTRWPARACRASRARPRAWSRPRWCCPTAAAAWTCT